MVEKIIIRMPHSHIVTSGMPLILCGSHPATVHLNYDKWNVTSTTGRERLIMHETGHSHGLDHHCTSDSIMNDGSSTCNGGKWTAIMSY
jgi:hypothetical protein